MRQATLCLLIKDYNPPTASSRQRRAPNQNKKELLLAMKKRGFGVGRWNGVGGKIDLEKGDTNITEAAIRETEEEIGVRIKDLEKVAVLSFYFPYQRAWDQDVHVFLVKDWEGEARESEEMLPKWFKIKEIPFEQMWDDDRFWLPQVLEGKKLKAKFVFEEGEKVTGKNVQIVENF